MNVKGTIVLHPRSFLKMVFFGVWVCLSVLLFVGGLLCVCFCLFLRFIYFVLGSWFRLIGSLGWWFGDLNPWFF